MADQEIVIIDDKGNEHVFPAGFDPKKAAGIVRQQANPAPSTPSLADMMHPQSINEAGEKLTKQGQPLSGFQRTVEEMQHPSPGQKLGMDVLPLAASMTAARPDVISETMPKPSAPAVRSGLRWLGRNAADIDITKPLKPAGKLLEAAAQEPANPNDLPLYKQMETIPTRASGPPPGGVRFRQSPPLKPLGQESGPQLTPEQTAAQIKPQLGSYMDQEAIGIMNRGAQMGDQTLQRLKGAGYDVPEGGFQSSHDIDRLLSGPSPTPSSGIVSPGPAPKGLPGGVDVQPSSDLEKMIMSMEHSGQASPTPGDVPPGPSLSLGRQQPMTQRMKLPATKSSRGVSPVDPRMSLQDQLMYATIMKANPQANPEEVVAELLKERAMRGNMYRSGGM